jgi:hypothetical protein
VNLNKDLISVQEDKKVPQEAVLEIRIRNQIRMFLGLPDLDPLFRGRSPVLPFSHKGVELTEIITEKYNCPTKF